MRDTSSKYVTNFIDNRLLFRHGWFRKLISDQGTAFTSREFEEFTQRRRFKHALCSAEHPESNGLCERVNRSITATLAAFVNLNRDDWDIKLQEAIFAINSAKHSTTQKSPFELVYGRVPVTPDEMVFPWLAVEPEQEDEYLRKIAKWRKVARSLILAQQSKSRKIADKFRAPDPVFKMGDLVLVSRKRSLKGKTKKFICRSIGPHQIVKRVNRVCYTVEDLPQNRRSRIHRRFNAHVSLIKRYHSRMETEWLPEDDEILSDDEREDLYDREDLAESDGPVAFHDILPVDQGLSIPDDLTVEWNSDSNTEDGSSEGEKEECLIEDGEEWNEVQVDLGVSRAGRVRKPLRLPGMAYYPP